MRRLRICQLITELAPAGAERTVYELARRLDSDRFEVRVVALRGGQVAEWLAEAGIKVTVLGLRGRWDLAKLAPLTSLLRQERIDVLHTHLFHADLAGRPAAWMAAVPHLVHTVHTAEGRFRPWQFAYARFFESGCDRLICVSPSVRAWHARRSGLPASSYTVIPNGIDPDAFERDPASRRRLRAEWGLADDDVLIVYVGRLHREKGIDTLLSALSHLSARGRPQPTVIAGDGPDRAMVETFIAHGEGGGCCRWIGFQKDVRGVLSAGDVFVMPSRWEGFPLALGEAMAASLPVVGTRVTGIQDLVEEGRTGGLVEREGVVELAETIETLASNFALRRRYGEAGRRRIVGRFSIDRMIRAHEALYLEVAGGGVRP